MAAVQESVAAHLCPAAAKTLSSDISLPSKPCRTTAHLTNKAYAADVSLQITVEAVIGDSVVLQCSSTQNDFTLQDINVHWRQNGKDSVAEQDPRYKNRAETFPDEYVRGNFSIKLTDLTHPGAGKYICYITQSSELKTAELIINGG
ncbi:hypothetical protein QQF64_018930 [Cirrhinus molitorella]|uniref:Ig-like domain-containing protein n=1 Tax=Cirrhinus molitorella TaxID=172907 RepID=A0ABR3LE12_9TELE